MTKLTDLDISDSEELAILFKNGEFIHVKSKNIKNTLITCSEILMITPVEK